MAREPKLTTTTAPAAAPEREKPEWHEDPPKGLTFRLEARDRHDGPRQTIDLTRDEYIILKLRLAEMRGLTVKPLVLTEYAFEQVTQALELLKQAVEDVEWYTANNIGSKVME